MRDTGRFIIRFVIMMCFKRHWPGFFLGIDFSGAGLIESLWLKETRLGFSLLICSLFVFLVSARKD